MNILPTNKALEIDVAVGISRHSSGRSRDHAFKLVLAFEHNLYLTVGII